MYQTRCPHCGGLIQVVRPVRAPVSTTCPSCGGTIHLQPRGAVAGAAVEQRRAGQPKREESNRSALLVATIVVGVLLVFGVILALHNRSNRGAAAPEQAQGNAGQRAAAIAGQNTPEITWPEFTPDNFPGLPDQIVPARAPDQISWGFEPGIQLQFRGNLRSHAALSPVDLGKSAQQVLQFLDDMELRFSLQCLRIDAGLATLRGEVEHVRGRMQAPSGRLEYDSRDGISFLPPDNPFTHLLDRPWQAIVAVDNGQVLRVEWPDGEIIEGRHFKTILSILPVVQLPARPAPDTDVATLTPDGREAYVRLLGQDTETGALVFVILVLPRREDPTGEEHRVLLFDPKTRLPLRLTYTYERHQGTGLPRVGSYRPALRTTGVIELLR